MRLTDPAADLGRRVLAEAVGTAMLVAVVVGSGIAAARLSPHDVGLELLENSLITALGLGTLILAFGPVSGAHLNPAVSVADWLLGRGTGSGLTGTEVGAYTLAQCTGAIGGAVLANGMFGVGLVTFSGHDRSDHHLLLGEVVATAGLVFLIFSLARSGRAAAAPAAVGAYIGAAYWFTSSTSFANPAVTIGRAFTDTFAGIEPTSVPGFIAAQIVGGALGLALLVVLYPHPERAVSTDGGQAMREVGIDITTATATATAKILGR
jgi:arsenate reductase